MNAVDKDGWTPLHAAAHWEQEEACRILAENGANFEKKTYSVSTVKNGLNFLWLFELFF